MQPVVEYEFTVHTVHSNVCRRWAQPQIICTIRTKFGQNQNIKQQINVHIFSNQGLQNEGIVHGYLTISH